MADKTHLEVINKGVAKWNEWRSKHPDVIPDLIEADCPAISVASIGFTKC